MANLVRGQLFADRFTPVQLLGDGPLRETWLARDALDQRLVALKVFSVELSASRDQVERLREHILRARGVKHPRILPISDLQAFEGRYFVWMEYLGGGDIFRHGGRGRAELLAALDPVVEALREAHALGLAHGRIAASNLLCDTEGAVYLVDLGIEPGAPGQAPATDDDVRALAAVLGELIDPASLPEADALRLRRLLERMRASSSDERPPDISAVRNELARLGPHTEETWIAPEKFQPRGRSPGAAAGADAVLPTAGHLPAPGPAQPPTARSPGATAKTALRAGLSRRRLVLAAMALLLLAAYGVFFVLPGALRDGRPRRAPETDAASPAAEAATPPARESPAPSTPPDVERSWDARMAAEEALRTLLEKKHAVEAKAAPRWAGDDYAAALERAQTGDALRGERRYAEAKHSYEDAASMLGALEERAGSVFREALRRGREALEAGRAAEARQAFSLAAAIDPDAAGAQSGLARSEKIDEVFGWLRSGAQHEDREDWSRALEDYEQALSLDSELDAARRARDRTQAKLTAQRFREAMSLGLAALDRNDFRAARAAFEAAGELKPGAPEVRDGLAQAESGLRGAAIRAHRRRALAFQSEERWQEALDEYRAALALNPSLLFAQQGQTFARERAEVMSGIEAHLRQPERLQSREVYEAASALARRAAALEAPGPRLLKGRARLEALLVSARTPVRLEIESDNMTEVVIYNVGRLGVFERREVTLRPGTYTAVGTRDGYRDVRRRFTLVPGETPPTLVLRCEEAL